MKTTALIALSTLFLVTACETSSALRQSAAVPQTALSCDSIKTAFAAVEKDKTSTEAYQALAAAAGLNSDSLNLQSGSIEGNYAKAKSGANTALALQGCQPL